MSRTSKPSLIAAQFNELFVGDDGKPMAPTDALTPAELVVLAGKLGISPDDVVLYAIAWRLECKTPCVITRAEWIDGFNKLGIDSLARLKEAVPAFRRELQAPARFRDFYNFVFEWSRENTTVRSVSIETALALWGMVFAGRDWKLLPKWLEFTQTQTGDKPVKRDVWRMTLDFSQTDISKYSTEASWPSVMDEFVKWISPPPAA